MSERRLERVTSGIPGLDEVLHGGFLKAGVYILIGTPGAGKTIFANQIAFHHAAKGGEVLYLSLLAESHARLFAHMENLKFFDAGAVSRSIHYVSGYHSLEQDGLTGLLQLLRREMRERKATLLVLDGLVSAEAFAQSSLALKKFVHELQTLVSFMDCTAFLLTSGSEPHMGKAEHTMVDGLIELTNDVIGVRQLRLVQVKKFRGSPHLGGTHPFEITSDGVTVYPRLESRVTEKTHAPRENPRRCPSGIPDLDVMLGGGIDEGSPTLLLGPAGCGKTLYSLAFLSGGLEAGENVVYMGFHESPARLLAKAGRIGIDLRKHYDSGALEIIWHPNVDFLADALVDQLLRTVAAKKATRVVIDSLHGLRSSIVIDERIVRFLSALANELRVGTVTSYFIEETKQLFSPIVDVPTTGLSGLVDNILFLRTVELRSQLYRVAAVLKTREYSHDTHLRTFTVSDQGIELGDQLLNAEAILTGIASEKQHGPPAAAGAATRPAMKKASKKRSRR